MYTLNVPPYSKYWPEDGLVRPKHVAKTVYYLLYIDVVLRLNKQLYWTNSATSWIIKYCCVWLKIYTNYCFQLIYCYLSVIYINIMFLIPNYLRCCFQWCRSRMHIIHHFFSQIFTTSYLHWINECTLLIKTRTPAVFYHDLDPRTWLRFKFQKPKPTAIPWNQVKQ